MRISTILQFCTNIENGYYWPSKRVLKTINGQGKFKKSGHFEIDIEWQP